MNRLTQTTLNGVPFALGSGGGVSPIEKGGTGGATAELARSSLEVAHVDHTHVASNVTDFDNRTQALAEEAYAASLDAKFASFNNSLTSYAARTTFLSNLSNYTTYRQTFAAYPALTKLMLVGGQANFSIGGRTVACYVVDVRKVDDVWRVFFMCAEEVSSSVNTVTSAQAKDGFGTTVGSDSASKELLSVLNNTNTAMKNAMVPLSIPCSNSYTATTKLWLPSVNELGSTKFWYNSNPFDMPENLGTTFFMASSDSEKALLFSKVAKVYTRQFGYLTDKKGTPYKDIVATVFLKPCFCI